VHIFISIGIIAHSFLNSLKTKNNDIFYLGSIMESTNYIVELGNASNLTLGWGSIGAETSFEPGSYSINR